MFNIILFALKPKVFQNKEVVPYVNEYPEAYFHDTKKRIATPQTV